MVIFSKLLPLFFLPIGLVATLVVVAIWRGKRWPGVVALVVLYLSSVPVVADRLIGWLETRHAAVSVDHVEGADAVIVLGGILGAQRPGAQPGWLDQVERFEAGITLALAGRAQHVVFSGARMPWEKATITEGDELRNRAITRGVPADRIVVSRVVANTADEARSTAELMRERGWKRVVVVTTGWHMPRAALQFRRAGVEAIWFPVDFRAAPRPVQLIDFVPTGAAWQTTETALRECYGYLFYRVFR